MGISCLFFIPDHSEKGGITQAEGGGGFNVLSHITSIKKLDFHMTVFILSCDPLSIRVYQSKKRRIFYFEFVMVKYFVTQ